VDEARDTVPVIGTQKVKRTVRVFLSNASGEARALRLIERIPVSEIADVEVSLGPHDGWKHKPADGMLERDLDLAPQGQIRGVTHTPTRPPPDGQSESRQHCPAPLGRVLHTPVARPPAPPASGAQ
jgi:hypothetical protein